MCMYIINWMSHVINSHRYPGSAVPIQLVQWQESVGEEKRFTLYSFEKVLAETPCNKDNLQEKNRFANM